MPDFIAIGDIHGMYHLLDDLLAKLPSEGELVFLGDYIDRGPDSKGVVARLIELEQARTCHFLRGNHEGMMFDVLDGRQGQVMWMRNGGLATIESYDGRPFPEHEAFLRRTLPYFLTEQYIFVHAGLIPGTTVEEMPLDELMWIREPFLSSDYDWGRLIIHGHTPCPNFTPTVKSNRINIDTGAVYSGSLTALLLPEREFISVG